MSVKVTNVRGDTLTYSTAASVTVDQQGHLFVTDKGNYPVAAFAPGSWVRADCQDPDIQRRKSSTRAVVG